MSVQAPYVDSARDRIGMLTFIVELITSNNAGPGEVIYTIKVFVLISF